jgi:hypothetical protein
MPPKRQQQEITFPSSKEARTSMEVENIDTASRPNAILSFYHLGFLTTVDGGAVEIQFEQIDAKYKSFFSKLEGARFFLMYKPYWGTVNYTGDYEGIFVQVTENIGPVNLTITDDTERQTDYKGVDQGPVKRNGIYYYLPDINRKIEEAIIEKAQGELRARAEAAGVVAATEKKKKAEEALKKAQKEYEDAEDEYDEKVERFEDKERDLITVEMEKILTPPVLMEVFSLSETTNNPFGEEEDEETDEQRRARQTVGTVPVTRESEPPRETSSLSTGTEQLLASHAAREARLEREAREAGISQPSISSSESSVPVMSTESSVPVMSTESSVPTLGPSVPVTTTEPSVPSIVVPTAEETAAAEEAARKEAEEGEKGKKKKPAAQATRRSTRGKKPDDEEKEGGRKTRKRKGGKKRKGTHRKSH